MNTVDAIAGRAPRLDLPPFRPGDTVRVHVKIKEGEKERTQVFEGVVLRRRRGHASATFTVRKVSYGVGVERVFPVESPNVEKVEIKSRGHVRRSRLYYLRALRGKKARLRTKLRDLSALIPESAQAGTAAEAEPDEALPAEAAESAEVADPSEVSETAEPTEAGEAAEAAESEPAGGEK